MVKYISIHEEDEWVEIAMRDPNDSDTILTLEGHSITAKELLTFLEKFGIIHLTNEI